MATRSEYQDLMTARGKDEARHAVAQDEKGCIVLSAERSEVKVRLYQPAGAVTETRRIIREKTHARTILFACSARTVRL